jgi:hypothetical protein
LVSLNSCFLSGNELVSHLMVSARIGKEKKAVAFSCTSILLAVERDTPCMPNPILLAVERDTTCTSTLLAVERDTPCSATLLAVERDTPCSATLLAVERDTPCTSIDGFWWCYCYIELKPNVKGIDR